jgi:hypothetical protein
LERSVSESLGKGFWSCPWKPLPVWAVCPGHYHNSNCKVLDREQLPKLTGRRVSGVSLWGQEFQSPVCYIK